MVTLWLVGWWIRDSGSFAVQYEGTLPNLDPVLAYVVLCGEPSLLIRCDSGEKARLVCLVEEAASVRCQ